MIARAAGALGMIGGQMLDIENENRQADAELMETTHRLKTGALISAACVAGCILAGATQEQREAAGNLPKPLGLHFR